MSFTTHVLLLQDGAPSRSLKGGIANGEWSGRKCTNPHYAKPNSADFLNGVDECRLVATAECGACQNPWCLTPRVYFLQIQKPPRSFTGGGDGW